MNLNHTHSLSHTKWNCKYHVVFAPKYRRKVFYGSKRLKIGAILRELCSWKEVNIIEKDMSPPTKELMKLTLEAKIAHGGHPVLKWNMDNIFIRTDPAGNIKADKEKSTEKIDGAIATIMALDRAIRCGNANAESVYDSRGILFV